jgi:hypothetical protein
MKKKYDNDYWMIPSDYSQLDHFVANYLGINEAIVLRLIYSMCRYKKQQYGTSWFQGSWIFWKSKLKFMSESKLRRVFDSLEKKGLIEKRIDYKTGNWYQPVQTAMEKMLKEARDDYFDDSFEVSENQAIQSVQNEQADSDLQNLPVQSEQAGLHKTNKLPVQSEQALLTSMSPISPLSLPNVATAHAAALQTVNQSEPSTQESTSKNKTTETWKAYSEWYERRYSVAPARNAKVNAQLKQFCERVGYEDAPKIIIFYLLQNDYWYVKQMHTIGVALSEAEKLVAGYRRGSLTTKREADYIDKTSSKTSFIQQILQLRRQKAQKGGTDEQDN